MILDIGCGPKKTPGSVGMDHQAREGVDIVHDLESFPWPVDSGSFDKINASHVLEHLKPWVFLQIMDECWRVLKPGGEMQIRTPYGAAYAFDPTHAILFQESSFLYLTPASHVYEVYQPKPWDITYSKRDESTLELRTVLKKTNAHFSGDR